MTKIFTKAMILVAVILMDILGSAEVDLFIPSFPELQSQFDLSPFCVEALLSVNFMGFCLSLFFVGALADRFGRKPIILFGIITFIIGSCMCLWALSYQFLLIGRFFQGIGAAAPATLCFLIITDFYPLKQQQFLMAMLNGIVNATVGFAPVVGCYITMYFHWQGNFVALLVLGFIVLIMTIFFIPTYKQDSSSISNQGYGSIFKSKPLMLMIVNSVFGSTPYWIFAGMAPILYMKDLGVSLSHFGYYQGSLAALFALGSVFFGLIVGKCDQKKMLNVAGIMFAISLIIIGYISYLDIRDPLLITLAFSTYDIAIIIPSTILYPLALNFMPEVKGRISTVIQGDRLILCAIGLEIVEYYYDGSFKNVGIIICCLIFIAVITLFLIIRNRELMKSLEYNDS
jgi:DHA1 family bicyclomycin/chloramphenicol resistance-like MFS transporter